MLAVEGSWAGFALREKRAELMRMIGDKLARNAVSAADVDLVVR